MEPAKTLRDAVHELNNLCSTILGFASLAEGLEPQHSALAAYLAEIRVAAEGVATTARELRALSQELETTR
jgi:signal transduction histidine kinase